MRSSPISTISSVLFGIAALFLQVSAALNPLASGDRVLVVHDASLDLEDYSAYFKTIEKQGFDITYRSAKQSAPTLFRHDDAQFDHLLLFAPSTKSFDNDLTPQRLVHFLRQNGNILFALSSDLSELYRDLGREFEIEFEERGTTLVDHFASLRSDERHTSIAIPARFINHVDGVFAGTPIAKPFLYKGVAHRLGSNPLAFPLLKPPSTSYSFELPEEISTIDRLDNPDRDTVFGSDSDVALISAFQLLDTERRSPDDGPKRQGSAGRAVFCGSIDAFSNAFVKPTSGLQTHDGEAYTGSSNLAVLQALTSWLTQQQGVLRVESTSHSRNKMHAQDVRESYEELDVIDEDGEHRIQRMYRIRDTVTYSIELSQRTPAGWVPAPKDLDLQVSLVMLDPYVTTNLTASQPQSTIETLTKSTSSPRSQRYSTTFQLPDRHGVYTFIVDWKRHGWSYIHTRDTSPVRPYNHDEHPRGLHSAWPYVVGATSTMVAFLAFACLWACSQEQEDAADGKLKLRKE